jgi:ribosomal protein L11 methyltransferase
LFSLLLRVPEQDHDFVIAELWERGTAGVVQQDGALEAFFDDAADSTALFRHFAPFSPEVRQSEHTDWVRQTEDSFPPQLIGDRFFLVPPWNRDPVPAGRIRLEINPGLACGTGWHPCTRLCLKALEQTVRPGDRVLDAGVGSGILSVAASLLGAGLVVGCDVDPEAVRIARERTPAPLFVGSVDAVASDSFDILVANISAGVAREFFQDFGRVARVIILSGFQESPDLPARATATEESDGWLCVLMDNRYV